MTNEIAICLGFLSFFLMGAACVWGASIINGRMKP